MVEFIGWMTIAPAMLGASLFLIIGAICLVVYMIKED